VSEKKRKLRAVFDKATPIASLEASSRLFTERYVPRAYQEGPGWGVYDRRLETFVDHKLAKLSLEELRDERWPLQ
jgi:hypothetical protein